MIWPALGFCTVLPAVTPRVLLGVLSTWFAQTFRVKPVYVILQVLHVQILLIWVSFWRSGFALNVIKIVRMRQRASSYKVATPLLQTGDFAGLAPVVNSCGGH